MSPKYVEILKLFFGSFLTVALVLVLVEWALWSFFAPTGSRDPPAPTWLVLFREKLLMLAAILSALIGYLFYKKAPGIRALTFINAGLVGGLLIFYGSWMLLLPTLKALGLSYAWLFSILALFFAIGGEVIAYKIFSTTHEAQ